MKNTTTIETIILYAKVRDLEEIPDSHFRYLIIPISTDINLFANIIGRLQAIDGVQVTKPSIHVKNIGKRHFFYEAFPLSREEMYEFGSSFKSEGYRFKWLGEDGLIETFDRANQSLEHFIHQYFKNKEVI